jgi:hypothetical protein
MGARADSVWYASGGFSNDAKAVASLVPGCRTVRWEPVRAPRRAYTRVRLLAQIRVIQWPQGAIPLIGPPLHARFAHGRTGLPGCAPTTGREREGAEPALVADRVAPPDAPHRATRKRAVRRTAPGTAPLSGPAARRRAHQAGGVTGFGIAALVLGLLWTSSTMSTRSARGPR